jgi:hypothetical protein
MMTMNQLIWQKKGLILSPSGAPAWRSAHCGMTSVLPWSNNLFRVFLTGMDEGGQFKVGWLDLDQNFNVARENPGNPVLPLGRMGCFDCRGMCMPTVVRVSEAVLYMYYAGWGLTAPGLFVNQCGLAISRDNGESWARWSEAPLPMLDDKDPIGVGTVFVLPEPDGLWRMWYTTFREWRARPDGSWCHYYHIKYAESTDGIHWEKPENNLAIDFESEDENVIGRPMVIKEKGFYRMWFSCRTLRTTYRIGYAESGDGRNWERKPSGIEPSASGWDSEMVEYAYVVKRKQDYVMFYNGNGFGGSGTGVAIAKQDN